MKCNKKLIINWVKKNWAEDMLADKTDNDSFFVAFMYTVTLFADTVNNKRCNDFLLFEIACYLYIRVDFWFYSSNELKYREEISRFLLDKMSSVFSQIFKEDNIKKIIFGRIKEYGKLIKTNDTNQLHFYLIQLLHQANENSVPKNYDRKFSNYDFFSEINLKIELDSFDDIAVKGFLKTLNNYIYYLKTQKLKPSRFKKIKR